MRPAFVVIAALIFLPSCGGSGGGLGGIRSAVRGSGSSSGGGSGGRSSGGGSFSGPGVGGEDLVGALGLTLSAPFWVPYVALQDDYTCRGYFLRYPYAKGWSGSLISRSESVPAPDEARRHSFRLLGDYCWDPEGIQSVRGHLLFTTAVRVGADFEMTDRTEDLGAGATDRLHLGRSHVLYRFAQDLSVQMRAGLGVIWMRDHIGTEEGVSFVYEGDFFPAKPMVLSASVEVASLGEATVFRLRATAGAIITRWEFFAGYDGLWVEAAYVGGPTLGVRCWF
jgi:hypothetical protein